MNMKLRKEGLYTKLGMLMLLFYSFFYGLRYVILRNTAVIIIWLFAALLLTAFATGRIKKAQLTMIVIALLCIIVIVVNRNARFAHQFYMFDFGIIVLFAAFIFLSGTPSWHNYIEHILMAFGIFYSVTTILLFIFPDIYINYVNPLFGGGYNMIRKARQGLAVGFSAHYSTTGMYLATTIGVPISYFMRKDAGVKQKWPYIFLIVVTFIALLLTGKRAHAIFTAVALLLCYYFMNSDKKMGRLFKTVLIGIMLILLFLFAAQFYEPLNNIIIRFQTTIEKGDMTLGRNVMLAECITMFKSNPIIGTGWGSFTYTTATGVVDAHNVFAQLLAENGIFLSIPFILFIVINYINIIKAAKRIITLPNKKNEEIFGISYSVFIQSFFLLYCLTGNPLYDFQFLCPYIIGCSIGTYYYYQMFGNSRRIGKMIDERSAK